MNSKKIRILSIDGGGIRGILPGVVLTYIEEQLRKLEGENVRLSDYFDLLVGTSTGGILACTYLIPGHDATGKPTSRPRFTAKEALNIYLERGDDIFDINLWQKIKSKGGLADEKYSATELEEALNDYFGNTLLSELLRPCLITSYDIRNRRAHFFSQVDARNTSTHDFPVKEVARATSAAPTYFEVARVKSTYGTPYPLIDGGVFANNPAMCAYAEARGIPFSTVLNDPEKPDRPFAQDMIIVSIGTGSTFKPYEYNKAKDWGMIEWIQPIIDIMMSGNAETVTYQLRKIWETTPTPDHFIRLTPDLYEASSEMDDASVKNLNYLHEAGKKFVSENIELLDRVVKLLIANK
ncbi:MAG: patatin-like phospholipase family protein [Lentimicrobium sp.]|jgi:patatin-like phospholipase/acyl hydrolase|nr:patatin-like phospholipase family protein [Lentimicrobium sp.]